MNTLLKFIKLNTIVLALALTGCAGSGQHNKTSSGAVPAGYYRVKPGDNLYRIGLRYGQSVKTLAAWNGLSDPSQIEVGQVLKVRSNATKSYVKSSPKRSATHQEIKPINRLNLIWPVDNGRQNIVGRFNGKTNKGIDISGTQGTPIKAAASGKVLYVGEGVRGYGKLVLISHNATTLTAYAHNSRIAVQKDQKVKQGDVIAYMGSSDSDRVKLHFELRVNGKAVDPSRYLH